MFLLSLKTLIIIILNEIIYSKKNFSNDTKCEKYGSMLINHLITKKPYSKEFEDIYKLLINTGTFLEDLGNYYGCKKIPYANYYLLSASMDNYTQFIGLCYFKECNVKILKNSINNLFIFLKNNFNFNLLNENSIEFFDPEEESINNKKKYKIHFIIYLIICFIFIFILPISNFFFPENSLLNNFNIRENFMENFRIKKPKNQTEKNLKIFNGIRVINSIYLILGEFTQIPAYYVKNMADMYFLSLKWYFPIISSAFFTVDTYLYISGFFYYYNLNKKSNIKNKENRRNILFNIFQRYFRFLPIMFYYTFSAWILTPFLTNGPNYQMMKTLIGGCEKNFWHNLLFINNFMVYDNNNRVCICNLWYISSLIQYCFLFTLIFYFCYKKKILRIFIFAFFYFISCVIQIKIMVKYKFTYNDVRNTDPNTDPFTFLYFSKPYERVNSFLIGMFFSYLFIHSEIYVNDFKDRSYEDFNEEKDIIFKFNNLLINNNKYYYSFLFIGLFIFQFIFWTSSVTNHYNVSVLGNALLLTFTKDFYVFGLGMIIHLILLNKLTLIKKLLSFNCYEILNNAGMGVLIFHDYFINMFLYQYAGIIYQGNADLLFFTLGIYITSVLFGYVILPFFESPFLKMIKKKFDVELINFGNEYINKKIDYDNNENSILQRNNYIGLNDEEINLKEGN